MRAGPSSRYAGGTCARIGGLYVSRHSVNLNTALFVRASRINALQHKKDAGGAARCACWLCGSAVARIQGAGLWVVACVGVKWVLSTRSILGLKSRAYLQANHLGINYAYSSSGTSFRGVWGFLV